MSSSANLDAFQSLRLMEALNSKVKSLSCFKICITVVVFSTAYHPKGNAPVEWGHQPLVSSIFKCTGDAKGTWPLYILPALFAMRVTVSWATGFSPYYLLYGAQPVFSFDVTEITWQTLDWDKVTNHKDLIVIRALQIARCDDKLHEANDKLCKTRRRAIEDLSKRVHFQFDFTDYEPGMYVWLWESHLDEIKGGKGEWTYLGPYVIHEKREHGSFVLCELSGAILKGHVNIQCLWLFYFWPEHQMLHTSLKPHAHQMLASNPLYQLDVVHANLTSVCHN